MPFRPFRTLAILAVVPALSACDGGGGERESLLRTIGLRQPPPDEFLVVERRPLEMPPSFAELPPPDPGAGNRTDPRPREEVSALLVGVTTSPTAPGGPSPGEAALLEALRAGETDPAIRATLAAEDAELQTRSGRYGLRSVLGRPTFDPYRDEVLDPFAETERLRAAGIQTPASPPPPPPPDGLRLF